jgi:hypothetical protein
VYVNISIPDFNSYSNSNPNSKDAQAETKESHVREDLYKSQLSRALEDARLELGLQLRSGLGLGSGLRSGLELRSGLGSGLRSGLESGLGSGLGLILTRTLTFKS